MFGRPLQPESSSIRQVAGVACMTVASTASSNAASATPSAMVARSASAMRAPTVSGSISSSNAISNDSVVIAHSVSSARRPGSRAIEARKLTAARCGMRTPLGRPVEPDVKIT